MEYSFLGANLSLTGVNMGPSKSQISSQPRKLAGDGSHTLYNVALHLTKRYESRWRAEQKFYQSRVLFKPYPMGSLQPEITDCV